MTELRKIKRALISVSDKAGIVEFAVELAGFGIEILSTGGTAKALRKGGLAMIRSAAKNWRDVAVVTDAGLYSYIINKMRQCNGCLPLETREQLAAGAFLVTSLYDLKISRYVGQGLSEEDLDEMPQTDPL